MGESSLPGEKSAARLSVPIEVQISDQGAVREVRPPSFANACASEGASTASRIARLAIHAWKRRRVGFIF
jgi:hypothetical protein